MSTAVLEHLAEAGQRLADADAARAAALDEIAAALKAAHGQVPISRMAEAAGVTRVTAYKLLER